MSGWIGLVRSVLGRAWVLYVIVLLLLLLLVDVKKLSSHAKPSTLSRLRPHYCFIGGLSSGDKKPNRKELEDQRVYLENVNLVMGERSDTDTLLAFVYFHLSDLLKSEKLFRKAVESNPTFFWNYFNLGLSAYNSGNMEKARGYLKMAVSLNPRLSMQFILSSRIYLPLLTEAEYSPQKFWDNLMQGYVDAYKLLVVIEHNNSHWQDVLSLAQAGLGVSSRDDDRVFFYYYIGNASVGTGAWSVALKAYDECLKLDKNSLEALKGMARILEGVGRADAAAAFMARFNTIKRSGSGGLIDPGELRVRVF